MSRTRNTIVYGIADRSVKARVDTFVFLFFYIEVWFTRPPNI